MRSWLRGSVTLFVALLLAVGGLWLPSGAAVETGSSKEFLDCPQWFLDWSEWEEWIEVPAGVCFVEMVGSSPLVLLDSEGRLYSLDSNAKTGQWEWKGPGGEVGGILADAPAGDRYIDIADHGSGMVYLDTAGGVKIRQVTGHEVDAPDPPSGTRYVAVDSALGGGIAVLLRSDGVVVCVSLWDKTWVGPTAGSVRVVEPPEGRRFIKTSGGYNYMMLLDSSGQVQTIPIFTERLGAAYKAILAVPRLPVGMRYVDIQAAGEASLYLRSDGKIIEARQKDSLTDRYERGSKVRVAPKGLRFLQFGKMRDNPVALLSDGGAVSLFAKQEPCNYEWGELDMVRSRYSSCGPVVPRLRKGLRYVGAHDSWATYMFAVAAIPQGMRVQSSIGEVVVPERGVGASKTSTLLAGSRPVVSVPVVCRGVLKGGKVVVRKGSKVVGKATIKKGSKASVPVNTKKLAVGKNRLKAQYMGNKACLKSAKTPFTVRVRSW